MGDTLNKKSRQVSITPELKKAAQKLTEAQTNTAKAEGIVIRYQREILAKLRFMRDPTWQAYGLESEVILEPKNAYELSDTDFAVYQDMCYQAARSYGFVLGPEQCPLLLARTAESEAEAELLKASSYLTRITDPAIIWQRENAQEFYDKLIAAILDCVYADGAERTLKTSTEIGNTILQQLGGNAFIAMTGAKHFSTKGSDLTFAVPNAKRDAATGKVINCVVITLEGNDTYTLEFKHISRTGLHTTLQTRGLVYCDQLCEIFKDVTGLATKL